MIQRITWKTCLGIIFLEDLISVTRNNVFRINFAIISGWSVLQSRSEVIANRNVFIGDLQLTKEANGELESKQMPQYPSFRCPQHLQLRWVKSVAIAIAESLARAVVAIQIASVRRSLAVIISQGPLNGGGAAKRGGGSSGGGGVPDLDLSFFFFVLFRPFLGLSRFFRDFPDLGKPPPPVWKPPGLASPKFPSETQKLVLADPAFVVLRFELRDWRSFV